MSEEGECRQEDRECRPEALLPIIARVHDGRRSFAPMETFELRHVPVELVCAIRHSLLKDVPCLAFDAVTFYGYTGPLEREYISHRIGQLPVVASDGHGGASDGDGAVFRCHVAAPEEPPGKLTVATTADFVLERGTTDGSGSGSGGGGGATPLAVMAWPDIDVVPLHPGQQVTLAARVARSTCRASGTRWQCAHVAVKFEGEPQSSTPAPVRLTVSTTGAVTPTRALWHALCAIETRLDALAK
jgi:hypothetical protein